MDNLVSKIESINSAVNNFAWGPVVLLLLVGTGCYLSIRTGFLQATRFGRIMKATVGTLFSKNKEKTDSGANLSPFQAVTTALAGTVGTGNIAGVTGAIFTGGPGAVFWMWIAAFFGMCTKYVEIALAMKYRIKDEKGLYHGGPMYYIKNGMVDEIEKISTFDNYKKTILMGPDYIRNIKNSLIVLNTLSLKLLSPSKGSSFT